MPDDQWVAGEPADLLAPEALRAMSGLEFLQGIRDGRIAHPPIGGALNYWIRRVETGEVTFEGTPTFACLNPMGAVHGGWYGTLLDSAMGCAVMSCLDKGQLYTTLEFKVNIVRPVPVGVRVEALGRVQHPGRRTSIAIGEITGVEDGRLYATGSTTCIIL